MNQTLSTFSQAQKYCQTKFSQILIFKHQHMSLQTILKQCRDNTQHQLVNQLQILNKLQKVQGFPRIISTIYDDMNNLKGIELQKLDITLKTLISNSNLYSLNIPLRSIIKLGLQMLERVQALHECGYLHMDLKPDHFLFQNADPQSCLYLIDFGLSMKINELETNSRTYIQIFKGNISYASTNKMKMRQQTIRDDLESLLYIIVEMLQGQLPWKPYKKIKKFNKCWKNMYSKILSKKLKKNKWKKYGTWFNTTLYEIISSQDPYNNFKKSICKLLQYEI